jgi:hypothetical protein
MHSNILDSPDLCKEVKSGRLHGLNTFLGQWNDEQALHTQFMEKSTYKSEKEMDD